tara:strand:- start:187 stop:363 length:177 start_codon:yes stop_codon:yes gene_type:complete
MSNTSFDIKEYSEATRKYTYLASVEAPSSDKAKEIYIKQTGWNKSKGFVLFVAHPVCR